MKNEIVEYKYERDFFPPDKDWARLKEQCSLLLKSRLLPTAIDTVEKAITTCLWGRELGLSPMTALNNISVIKGKPTLEAKLMLALVFRNHPNAHYKILRHTSEVSEIEIGRSKDSISKFSMTIQQAKDAGLTAKDNWKKYPADMLLWRSVAKGVRFTFPDVLTVMSHTPEELEVINITPVPVEKEDVVEVIEPRGKPKPGLEKTIAKIQSKTLEEPQDNSTKGK